jgi:hypothetical protein
VSECACEREMARPLLARARAWYRYLLAHSQIIHCVTRPYIVSKTHTSWSRPTLNSPPQPLLSLHTLTCTRTNTRDATARSTAMGCPESTPSSPFYCSLSRARARSLVLPLPPSPSFPPRESERKEESTQEKSENKSGERRKSTLAAFASSLTQILPTHRRAKSTLERISKVHEN